MQGRQRLLRHAFDRNRPKVLIARRLEQRLGVGAIGLVAVAVALHRSRWQEQRLMTEFAELAAPVVCRPGCLEQNNGGLTLCEELQELRSRQPMALGDLVWVPRDRDLEDVLCQGRRRWS
jgi:hypothetical protein